MCHSVGICWRKRKTKPWSRFDNICGAEAEILSHGRASAQSESLGSSQPGEYLRRRKFAIKWWFCSSFMLQLFVARPTIPDCSSLRWTQTQVPAYRTPHMLQFSSGFILLPFLLYKCHFNASSLLDALSMRESLNAHARGEKSLRWKTLAKDNAEYNIWQ